MSVMSDAIITYAILRKFTTPIKDTPAYKLGLIDDTGTPTEKSKHITSETEKDAYTLLDRLVFKLRKMFRNMPAFTKLIGGYATALAFIKEDVSKEDDFSVFEHLNPKHADLWGKVLLGESILGIDESLVVQIAEDSSMLRKLVEAYESGTEDSVCEEMTASAIAGNAVSTGQVQGLATEPVITKKKQKEIQDKNWEESGGRKTEPIIS